MKKIEQVLKKISGVLCLVLSASVLICNTAIAQKSSGILEGDEVKTYVSDVEQINDTVTKDAATAGNAVRFLLRPIREADISPNMTGIVSKIHYNVGQRFKKGDTLISIRCDSLAAQLKAQAARVQQYKLEYQADSQMLEGNAVSRFTVDKSKSSLEEQEALHSEAVVNYKNCKVRAPFSGGVISKNVQAYEAVTQSDVVMSIVDDSGLVMSLNVPSSYVNKVKPKDKFTVTVDETGKTYAAEVVGVSTAIDPVSKTIELRAAVIEGLEELVPGMSGRANMDFTR